MNRTAAALRTRIEQTAGRDGGELHGTGSRRGEAEDGAMVASSAGRGGAVEISAGIFQSGQRLATIAAATSGAEIVERRQRTARGDFEKRSAGMRSSHARAAVIISIHRLDQRSV